MGHSEGIVRTLASALTAAAHLVFGPAHLDARASLARQQTSSTTPGQPDGPG